MDSFAYCFPSSHVELVITKFTIFNENSLHISILSFKRKDGHNTLVFSIEILFQIASISVVWKLRYVLLVLFILSTLECFEYFFIITSIISLMSTESMR